MKVTKVSKCKQLFKLYFGMKFLWKIAYLTLVSKFFCLLSCCQKVVRRNSARWRLKCKFKVNEGSLICDYEIWIRIWPSIKWKDWDRVRCFFFICIFHAFSVFYTIFWTGFKQLLLSLSWINFMLYPNLYFVYN